MGAGRDNVSPQELLEEAEMAALLYEGALVERAQVISNAFVTLPPLRDFGDAALLGRAFPPPSETLWVGQLADTVVVNGVIDLGEARLSAVQDLVGRALGRRLGQVHRFCNRLRKHVEECRVTMQRLQTVRDRWIASQDERSELLAEIESRFGPASESLPRMEFRLPEFEAKTAAFAEEWRSRHARLLNELHRGYLDSQWSVMRGAPYGSLPNPWSWTTAQLRAMHGHYGDSVDNTRYALEACVRGLHRAHLSHTQARLCGLMAAAAHEQQRLDALAEEDDDWDAAARHEVDVLNPIQAQYEYALAQMVAQGRVWQSNWHSRTYSHLLSADDAAFQVLEERHAPLTEEEVAEAAAEAQGSADEREQMTIRLDAMITEDGAALALADGLANRCTEALLVRTAWERDTNWPESKLVLDTAIDEMLATDNWRDRNHRGVVGADEAAQRIYSWVAPTRGNRRALGTPKPRRVKCDNPNLDDWNRPLLPCPTTTTDSSLSSQRPLPPISQAAAVAFGRRLFAR
jgi:hypothetical protein